MNSLGRLDVHMNKAHFPIYKLGTSIPSDVCTLLQWLSDVAFRWVSKDM